MSTYKGIQGYSVQTLASDPSPTASVEGQLWYNSTSGTYKIAISAGGAWSSAPAMNTGKTETGGARAGTTTAALSFAGDNPSVSYLVSTEKYNGTSWTEVSNLNQDRAAPGYLGTQTAAMCISGYPPSPGANYDEQYNGTSWSEVAEINSKRNNPGGGGTVTAGIIAGGGGSLCETWNGTSWCVENELLTARAESGFAGTVNTAALVSGGSPSFKDITEIWNGTSWSETNQMTTARCQFAASFGSSTAALDVGGLSADPNVYSLLTEKWDGTSWSETGDIALATRLAAGGGTTSAGMTFGGRNSGAPEGSTTSQEWADPVYAIKTVTTS